MRNSSTSHPAASLARLDGKIFGMPSKPAGADVPNSDATVAAGNNDRISAAEAAVILGIDREKVYRLMDKGRIPTYGDPHSFNRIRRIDAEQLRDRGEPIPLSEAARLLRRPVGVVRDLVANGELHSIARSKRPVFRREVEQYAAQHPRPQEAAVPPPGREGQVRTPAAARILDMSQSNTRRLAAEGLLPADRDDAGNYWYRLEHLELAQAAAAAHERGELPAPAEVDP
ncbi:helix-turn-helix protein [Kribbella orskensis]|uniref:Helix-turn-helix protein n=1 Tax=Kribbella orskensis TaxID=2512216 RepID=A0ABY2B8Z8_9ACTN|nr:MULTISPECIES: helix-turn-helix domain-containing protein [Kribbella]TCN32158.1 helix-turn-helix protein [Kribbella sp. VKM Ac-2500]TCO12177.1 helix-turn-helix protein [Kribbella orskensis]